MNDEISKGFRVITTNEIMFEFIHEDAKLPVNADPEGSSGYDLCSVEACILEPGEIKLVPTGLKWQPVTNDIEMQVRPRSGLAAKHGITVLNSPGTVDASYRGEIKVILINHGKLPYQIEVGERIAQAVFAKVIKGHNLVKVSSVDDTIRGTGGMGSTGRF